MPPFIEGDGDYPVRVVGTSRRQRAIEAAAGGRSDESAEVYTTAVLRFEDDNPHDPNAVAVYLGGRHVGYLDREHARGLRLGLHRIGQPGDEFECAALIVGGWDRGGDDVGHFGVRLDLRVIFEGPVANRSRPRARRRPSYRRKRKPAGCSCGTLLWLALAACVFSCCVWPLLTRR